MPSTRAEIIARSLARLIGAGVETPERDARLLYRWAAGMTGAELSASLSDIARPAEIARFEAAVEDRVQRIPVSKIVGHREFWGRAFRVTADVLDPRPETETLIAAALDGPAPARILDLGTGSGCILLTLLAEWPDARGVGVDLSAAALAVARANAAALGLADRAALVRSDWYAAVEGEFDLIVSNPPYIPESEIPTLAPEVRLHDPRMALTPGGDGLGAYRAIAEGAWARLAPGGRVMVEVGVGQADSVAGMFRAAGLATVRTLPDLDGRPRVVMADR